MRSRRVHPRQRSGFSLLELVLVVTIVGTFAAIAVPRYNNSLIRYRVDSAAQRIVNDFEYARTQAMSRSRAQLVVFDLTAEAYVLPNVEGLSAQSESYRVKLGADPYRVDLASASFGGSNAVTFDLFGKPSNSGTVVVQIGTTKRTISLSATTGKASYS
ncbi:MAG: GspH/FimT family pseudopilin [Tepidisphaeraceae bacterium]